MNQDAGLSERSGPLCLAIAGLAVVLSLYSATAPSSSQAADWSGRVIAHITSAGNDGGSASKDRAGEKRVPDWLLVQSVPLVGAPGEDLVLAEVPEFAPESVEERIAREHGLQLVTRLTVGGPGRRIVVYRAFDGRSPAEVVAALKRDQRVSSAQTNAVYRLPPAAPAQGAINDAKPPLGISGRQAKRQRSRHDQKGSGPTSGPRATAGEPVTALPRSAIVTNDHGRLRWPTADEPFLDIGMAE